MPSAVTMTVRIAMATSFEFARSNTSLRLQSPHDVTSVHGPRSTFSLLVDWPFAVTTYE